jgi:integrase/recombinase XerC
VDSSIIPFARSTEPSTVQVPLAAVGSIELYGALLADASTDATRRARVDDVAALGRFLGLEPVRAVALVVSGSPGQANAIAMGWKADQLGKKLSPNTINRRLSTLRRSVRVARRLGLVDWALDVDLLRSEVYRDVRGPGTEGWRSILAVATKEAAGGSPRALRDLALIRCLHDRGLRSIEVRRLEVSDCDLEGRRLAVIGKGKKERSWLTINRPTSDAIGEWIRVRGPNRGPLMIRVDRGAKADRLEPLTHAAIWQSVRRLGKLAGLVIPARPHGLRHQATTRLLDLTGGDVRRVRRFTRHASLDVLAIYDDARQDFGGQLSELLAGDETPL